MNPAAIGMNQMMIRVEELDCTPVPELLDHTISAIQAWVNEDDIDGSGMPEPQWMAMFIEDDDVPVVKVEHQAFLRLDHVEQHVQYKFCAQAGNQDTSIAIQPFE